MRNKINKIKGFTHQNFLRKISGGYTIIETMITVSLFIVVTTVGMGSLLNAHAIHQKSRDMRSIMDNLSFIMEDMSRNLRTGKDYHCGDFSAIDTRRSCVSGGSNIFFEEVHASANPAVAGDQWGYKIENGNISKSTNGGSAWVQLDPDDVVLDSSSGFIVSGAETLPDRLQPYVTIKLSGTITSKGVSSPFSLQTSVSQRRLDTRP